MLEGRDGSSQLVLVWGFDSQNLTAEIARLIHNAMVSGFYDCGCTYSGGIGPPLPICRVSCTNLACVLGSSRIISANYTDTDIPRTRHSRYRIVTIYSIHTITTLHLRSLCASSVGIRRQSSLVARTKERFTPPLYVILTLS